MIHLPAALRFRKQQRGCTDQPEARGTGVARRRWYARERLTTGGSDRGGGCGPATPRQHPSTGAPHTPSRSPAAGTERCPSWSDRTTKDFATSASMRSSVSVVTCWSTAQAAGRSNPSTNTPSALSIRCSFESSRSYDQSRVASRVLQMLRPAAAGAAAKPVVETGEQFVQAHHRGSCWRRARSRVADHPVVNRLWTSMAASASFGRSWAPTAEARSRKAESRLRLRRLQRVVATPLSARRSR